MVTAARYTTQSVNDHFPILECPYSVSDDFRRSSCAEIQYMHSEGEEIINNDYTNQD